MLVTFPSLTGDNINPNSHRNLNPWPAAHVNARVQRMRRARARRGGDTPPLLLRWGGKELGPIGDQRNVC